MWIAGYNVVENGHCAHLHETKIVPGNALVGCTGCTRERIDYDLGFHHYIYNIRDTTYG